MRILTDPHTQISLAHYEQLLYTNWYNYAKKKVTLKLFLFKG